MRISDIKTRGPLELMQDAVEFSFKVDDVLCAVKIDGRAMVNREVFTRALGIEILAAIQDALEQASV